MARRNHTQRRLMPAAPKTHFSGTEVSRRFRAARRQVLGGTQYIIQFQRKGQGLPLDVQSQYYCIPTWEPQHIVAWRNDPVRMAWEGDYLYAIEECGPLAHGFVLDCCRYIRNARYRRGTDDDPIEELYDNVLLWLGTPEENPRAYLYGSSRSSWIEVPYLRPASQASAA